MKLKQTESANVATIVLDGALDAEGAPDLLPLIDHSLTTMQRFFLVDLSKVTQVSSVGLEILLEASRRVAAQGGRIVFAEPEETLAAILMLTRLDRCLEIQATREEAFLALRAED